MKIKASQSNPILLSDEIFHSYYYTPIDKTNTGLLVEDGCFEFMFIKESNVQLKNGNQKIMNLPAYFGIGKVKKPYKLVFSDDITLFAIKLQPWVAGFYFKSNKSGIYSINHIAEIDFKQLAKNIFRSETFHEMVNHVERHLSKIKSPIQTEFNTSMQICKYIQRANGKIKVQKILASYSCSRQKLNRIFSNQTKNSIKEYSIYVKIRSLIEYKSRHSNKSLTHIAYDFGYFDQAHFIKDFKKVTGVNPSRFFTSMNITSSQLICST